MKKEDPEHAFPWDHGYSSSEGMELRDYFAAKAMQMFLHPESVATIILSAAEQGKSTSEVVTEGAYNLADAMMKARNLSGSDFDIDKKLEDGKD